MNPKKKAHQTISDVSFASECFNPHRAQKPLRVTCPLLNFFTYEKIQLERPITERVILAGGLRQAFLKNLKYIPLVLYPTNTQLES